MTTDPLRWGVLGSGPVARRFVEEVTQGGTGEVRGVASRSAEQAKSFARELGVPRGFGSYDDLLADDSIDAVYVATVPGTHADLAVRAARARRHVLVEKPLAVTYAQARAAVEAATAAGTLLVEAYLYRFHPQTRLLVDLIRDGAIGELHSIEASCGSMVEPWPDSTRADPELGGGGIVAVGCYPVSLARLLAGTTVGRPYLDPDTVTGSGTVGETGVDEWAVATLGFPGGVSARVAAGLRAGDDNTVKVYGSRGHLLVPRPWLVPVDEPGAVVLTTVGVGRRTVSTEPALPYARAAHGLAAALGTGRAPALSGDDALGNAQTLDRWRAAVDQRHY